MRRHNYNKGIRMFEKTYETYNFTSIIYKDWDTLFKLLIKLGVPKNSQTRQDIAISLIAHWNIILLLKTMHISVTGG